MDTLNKVAARISAVTLYSAKAVAALALPFLIDWGNDIADIVSEEVDGPWGVAIAAVVVWFTKNGPKP